MGLITGHDGRVFYTQAPPRRCRKKTAPCSRAPEALKVPKRPAAGTVDRSQFDVHKQWTSHYGHPSYFVHLGTHPTCLV